MKTSLSKQLTSFIIIGFFLVVSFASIQPHVHFKSEKHQETDNCSICHLNKIISLFSVESETVIQKTLLTFYDRFSSANSYLSIIIFDCFIERAPPKL